MRQINLFAKRLFDIFASFIGIILLIVFPVYLIVILAIRITSKGPALFKQTRVGKDTRPFVMFKFRTMIVEQYDANGEEIMSEDRITKIGKILRKTSLDETPQLFNILFGHMSFVGPRPMLEYQAGRCTKTEKRRFIMRPGVTGLAQIKGRNNIVWTERIKYDVEYVEKFNVFYDFMIIVKTILLVFKKTGTDVKPEYRQVDRFSRDYIPEPSENIENE